MTTPWHLLRDLPSPRTHCAAYAFPVRSYADLTGTRHAGLDKPDGNHRYAWDGKAFAYQSAG